MARPSNTHERRAQILAAYRLILAERGYDGATILDVARAAGLSAGLLHYHFEDKRAIMVALVEDLATESGERLAAAIAVAGEEPQARLDAYLASRLRPAGEPGAIALACWVAVAAESIREVQVRRAYEGAILAEVGRLSPLVDAALAANGRDDAESGAIAAGLMALVHGYFLLGTASPWLIPPGSAYEQARRTARGMLAGGDS